MIFVKKDKFCTFLHALSQPVVGLLFAVVTLCQLPSTATAESDRDQLSLDVDTLNEIVARYENARGWFSDDDDAQLVIARLSYAGGNFDLPLMRQGEGVLLVPVMAEEAPAREKWAYWNHSKNRFVVWRGKAPIGAEPILCFKRTFRGFPRGLRSSGGSEETVATSGKISPGLSLIGEPRPEPTRDAVVPSAPVKADRLAGAWSSGAVANGPRLAAPVFDPPAKIYPMATYPLSVKIDTGSVPAGAKVLVSINSGEWASYELGSRLEVNAGDHVLSYLNADGIEGMSHSEPAIASYAIEPIKLKLGLRAPVKALPVDAITPGSEQVDLFPAIVVENVSRLPSNARDTDSLEVLWTIDGSDPRISNTAFPVLFEGDVAKAQSLPMVMASFLNDPEDVQIRAIARAKNDRLLSDSDEVSVVLRLVR